MLPSFTWGVLPSASEGRWRDDEDGVGNTSSARLAAVLRLEADYRNLRSAAGFVPR
jgi:hypothetical protein